MDYPANAFGLQKQLIEWACVPDQPSLEPLLWQQMRLPNPATAYASLFPTALAEVLAAELEQQMSASWEYMEACARGEKSLLHGQLPEREEGFLPGFCGLLRRWWEHELIAFFPFDPLRQRSPTGNDQTQQINLFAQAARSDARWVRVEYILNGAPPDRSRALGDFLHVQGAWRQLYLPMLEGTLREHRNLWATPEHEPQSLLEVNAQRRAISSSWESFFGELRSLLHKSPSATIWYQLLELIELCEHPRELEQQGLPYILEQLSSWDPNLRRVPGDWMEEQLQGTRRPLHALARDYTVSSLLEPEALQALQRTVPGEEIELLRLSTATLERAHLALLEHAAPGLRALYTTTSLQGPLLEAFGELELPHLETLSLLSPELDEDNISALLRSPLAAELRHLKIQSPMCTAPLLDLLAQPGLENLRRLELDEVHARTELRATKLVRSSLWAGLEHFALHRMAGYLDDTPEALIEEIAAAPLSQSLRKLSFSGMLFHDDHARALADAEHLSGLQILELAAAAISNRGQLALAQAEPLQGLQELNCYSIKFDYGRALPPLRAESAREVLAPFMFPYARYSALTAELRPRRRDYVRLFGEELGARMATLYEEEFWSVRGGLGPEEGQSELAIVELGPEPAAADPPQILQLREALEQLRPHLREEASFFAFAFHAPEERPTRRMWLDSLIELQGRWILVPEPWRGLTMVVEEQ